MAKRLTNPVKIRINRDRLDALYNVCDDMLQQLKPENEHEKLMREYLGELHHMLQKKIATGAASLHTQYEPHRSHCIQTVVEHAQHTAR